MKENIVITMAGRGSRFYAAGYTVPKYEIIAHDHSLFYWSLLSLRNFLTSDSRLIFVCLKENNSSEYVHAQCKGLGLKDVHIIELEKLTDGQATSAYMSRSLWNLKAPLMIYNIDTYVKPDCLSPQHIRSGSDGWVPCFRVPGDHWSFVRIGSDGWAVDVAEKERISEYASIGLYWFSRASDYVNAYEKFFSDPANLVRGERYVAPLYKFLIQSGSHISISDLLVDDIHVLGTPAELDGFKARNVNEII